MSDIMAAGGKTKVVDRGLKVWRRLTQTAGLLVLGQWSYYGIFRCPFVVPYVSCQNCPVITCHGRLFTMFWGFWLLLPLSVFLFGRAFCGWACPGGLLNQLTAGLAPFKLKKLGARFFAHGKLLVLTAVLAVWLVMGQPREAIPIRVGEFFVSTGLTFEHASLFWLTRTGFVLTAVAAGLILANAWCRFLCPTGGLLDLTKGVSLFKFYKTRDCNDCNRCLEYCDMGTRPEERNCTNCGDCFNACPQDAIRFGRGSGK